MSRSIIFCIVFIFALAFMISCSGDGENIVTPEPMGKDAVSAETTGGTLCLGLWQISIDPATGTGDIVQLRSADKIINVLGFMEPPPLTLMDLDWANLVIDEPNNIIEVGVILTHPLAGDPIFTGFDVRGVCFGPEVANSDGLTVVTSPQYFIGVPFGYQDGLLGVPDSVANYSGLAGYKYFCDGLNATEDLADFFSDTGNLDDRGKFGSGNNNQRDYILDWTDSDESFFVFNYSIYANYDWPVGGTDLDDFDIATANSAEAFCFSVTELANSLFFASGSGGGSLSLQVAIWDWLGDIDDVTIKSKESGILAETAYDVSLGAYPNGKSYGFEFYDLAVTPEEVGDLDLIITATDAKTFGECWFLDLLPTSNSMYNTKLYNCFIHTTTVIECAPPVPTSMTPSDLLTYPGVYDDVDIVGDFFTLAGGVTDVYLDDGTTEVHATDINVIDDENLTCDFDLLSGFTGDEGDYDLVVVTACEGRAVDMASITDNLLFYADFADGDGGCTGIGGYTYCSSTGRWEENSCGSNYTTNDCSKFLTPEFDVPASATDVHFIMDHSGSFETFWDGCVAGWTNNGGTNMWGDACDGNNSWKYESGFNFNQPYLVGMLYNSGCVGCGSYYKPGYPNWCWAGNWGSVGNGVLSQFHTPGTENIKGMNNVQFMVLVQTDGSVQYRGHEIYELTVWYDPA